MSNTAYWKANNCMHQEIYSFKLFNSSCTWYKKSISYEFSRGLFHL